MHCALNYVVGRRFDMASRRRLFHQEKRKSGNTETTWKKLSVKAKCSTISFRSWTLFWKEWTWLTLRSHRNRQSLLTWTFGCRKRLSPGMIFLLLLEHLLEKKNGRGRKRILPRILSFIILCDRFVLRYLFCDYVVCDSWRFLKNILYKILSVSFSWFFEICFF